MSTSVARQEQPPDDLTQFLHLYNRLCVALRQPQDDSGIAVEVYFDALRDVPFQALQGGATALMREPGRRFFPTTAEWRQAALVAQEALLRETLRADRPEPWHFDCLDCEDTGWVIGLSCPGLTAAGLAKCERTRPHAPHPYTRACSCRATNRTFRRHQTFGAGAI